MDEEQRLQRKWRRDKHKQIAYLQYVTQIEIKEPSTDPILPIYVGLCLFGQLRNTHAI